MTDEKKNGKRLIPKKLRGILIEIESDCLKEIKDVAFVEIPRFLIEEDGRRSPFLRVVTEQGSYRIKVEKI